MHCNELINLSNLITRLMDTMIIGEIKVYNNASRYLMLPLIKILTTVY